MVYADLVELEVHTSKGSAGQRILKAGLGTRLYSTASRMCIILQ